MTEPPAGRHPGHRDRRHPRGWRVDPAPDGRGTPPPQKRASPWRSLVWFVVFLLTLLTVNTYLASQIQRPEERVRITYSPMFLDQVEAGNVKSISSQHATVQGEFRKAVTTRRAREAWSRRTCS
jgi:hypothetical protein